MSFHTRMSVSCAETISSFLTTAAQRFEEDAKLAREVGGRLPGGHAKSHESLAQQFDKQARQARKLAEQFSDAWDNSLQATQTIEEGR
jgi:hypothetical protein